MSAVLLNRKCLVLNKNWSAIGAIPVEDAICKVFSTYNDGSPKARIIEPESFQTFTWADWSRLKPQEGEDCFSASQTYFRIPEIILLSKYEKLPRPKAHFSRRTLYKRDKMQCQYCGCKPGSEELTVDHVNPRCLGGGTTWENCVLCCVACNRKKADKTLAQCKMKLLKEPKKPDMSMFKFETLKPVKSWQAFLGQAYWNVELENDNIDYVRS